MTDGSLNKSVWRTRTPFMMPIFYHLFEDSRKVYKLYEVLNAFDLSVTETNQMPFFTLSVKKEKK